MIARKLNASTALGGGAPHYLMLEERGRLPMGQFFLDRRQEPRFELPGRFRCITQPALSGTLVDLSLNGALLESKDEPSCKHGEVVELLFELEDMRPFAASARIAHVHEHKIGIEFQGIEPEAFEHLSELVLALKRAPTLAILGDPAA